MEISSTSLSTTVSIVTLNGALNKGLDSQTAYSIVSIDIADIDVGANVGARLQADQAEADVRIARAKVTLAEAEVPQAMASAYREGNLRTLANGQ